MGFTAELAADVIEERQLLTDDQVTPEDMADPFELEVNAMERQLGCTIPEWERRNDEQRLLNRYYADVDDDDGEGDGELEESLSEMEENRLATEEANYDRYLAGAYEAEIAAAYADEEAHYPGIA
ncbi:MAG: hypothetical protein AB9886_01990 [Candidatus Cryosericum sp.]